jgi:hypothetical protein
MNVKCKDHPITRHCRRRGRAEVQHCPWLTSAIGWGSQRQAGWAPRPVWAGVKTRKSLARSGIRTPNPPAQYRHVGTYLDTIEQRNINMKGRTAIVTTWCYFFGKYFHGGPCNKNWSEHNKTTVTIIIVIVISEFMTFYLLASAVRRKPLRTRINAVYKLKPANHKDPLPNISAFLTLGTQKPTTQAVMTSDQLHRTQPSFSCTRNSLPHLDPVEVP